MRPVAAALAALAGLVTLGIAAGTAGNAATTTTPQLLAFVKPPNGLADPSVYLANGDGTGVHRLAARADQPLVSPNGQMVAVVDVATGGPALLIYNIATGARRPFFWTDTQLAQPLAWSPDSRYLAVALNGNYVNSDGNSGIDIIDTSGYTQRLIAHGYISGASFSPDGTDRVAYASGTSQQSKAPVNLHVAFPDGSSPAQVTFDGHSLFPVWGASGIAFAHETPQKDGTPDFQIVLITPRGNIQLTHVKVSFLTSGLVPLAFDAGGNHLLAEFEGQDQGYAYTITLSTRKLHELLVKGRQVQGLAISGDGSQLLVDSNETGGLFNKSDVVEQVPFAGGNTAHVLAHGEEASWNR
jgi:Tol biopolymer transport system component